MVVIDLVEPNHNSGTYQLCFYFYIFDIIILQKGLPFKFHIGVLSNPQTISEKIENEEIGSIKLSKDQLCRQRRQNHIKKMRSKNKRKSTSSLDNISTSCKIGNNNVDNDIDFNMVAPVEE